jgi:PKD repeat protein
MKKLYSLLIATFALLSLPAFSQTSCNLHASFVYDSTQSPTIHFINQSTGYNVGDSINWTFGDGTSSHEPNPNHLYTAPGTYHVCLHVKKHESSCSSEFCRNITIVQPCELHPNYTHVADSMHPRTIYFTNTTVPAAAAVTASWSFGDGTGASTWNAVHEYAQPGRYYVCLTIHSGNCVATRCDSLTVLPSPTALDCNHITVGFYDTRDSSAPNRIKFTATANAPILDQVWTIVKLPSGNTVTIHANNPTFTFQDTGSYRVCLHAKFSASCTREVCKTIHITSVPASSNCMQVYPNPASGVVNAVISLPAPVMIHAYIYNTSNVLVIHREQQGVAGSNTVTINTGSLPAGIYTIKLVWEGHSCSATFLKQ